LAVDLAAQTITTTDGSSIFFVIDDFRKRCLMEGLDDIALTLANADAIRRYESIRKQAEPWLF
jgi:3-isopropylmalate/(R)-2-methylmalate dehydratase small subunit